MISTNLFTYIDFIENTIGKEFQADGMYHDFMEVLREMTMCYEMISGLSPSFHLAPLLFDLFINYPVLQRDNCEV